MGRIRVLPDEVVDRIAAGEVVERPASVVKELVENSLDAGAGALRVFVEGGGRRRIRVIDDGTGLDQDDALLALERHATSKIRLASDIDRIETLGFRGEALPSIASVSRMTLVTAPDESGVGTKVVVHGGTLQTVETTACPRGTTVEVRDLFFNTPVRRKFLRSERTESRRIVELVTELALSRPAVRFELRSGQRYVFRADPARDRGERITQLFGAPMRERLIEISEEHDGFRIAGFIGSAQETRSTRAAQHVWVNGRILRDRTIAHALSEAYAEVVPRGRYAVVFLELTIPSDRVDINVHPAKTEVRFLQARWVHDLVRDAVARALRSTGALHRAPHRWTRPVDAAPAASGRETRVAEALERYLDDGVRPGPGPRLTPMREGWSRPTAPREPDTRPVAGPEQVVQEGQGAVFTLAQYRHCYILARDDEGLLLVDQHVAHERVLFEELMQGAARREAPRQKLLFPLALDLPPAERMALRDHADELGHLGFTLDGFGGETLLVREVPAACLPDDAARLMADLAAALLVREVPAACRPDDAARLMADLAAALLEGEGPLRTEEVRRRAAATTACHAAVKINDPLTLEKMDHILERLFRCRTPTHCPHGRPIILRISLKEIERAFGRR
jgi:DNA mismatch repair protein MutL